MVRFLANEVDNIASVPKLNNSVAAEVREKNDHRTRGSSNENEEGN